MIFIFYGDITIPECPAVYICLHTHTYTHTVFDELVLLHCLLLQLGGKQYPLKAVRTLKKNEKKRKKKTVSPFRENLLGSRRPFPGLVEFFMLGAISHIGSP